MFYLLHTTIHEKYLAKAEKKCTQYSLNSLFSSSTFLIINIQAPSVYRESIEKCQGHTTQYITPPGDSHCLWSVLIRSVGYCRT